jgi:hypothetical protein
MKLLIRLLLIACLAFVAGALLGVTWNPEADFWIERRKQEYHGVAALRESFPEAPLVLFCGGSSCAFSVDPAIVTAASGRPAYNLGTSARAGPKYYVDRAFRLAREGDIVVLGIEPNFLTEPELLKPSSLGLALAWRGLDPAAAVGGRSFGGSLSLREHIALLRPGARYLVTWLGKRLSGGPRYHYGPADQREGGRLETALGHPTGRGDMAVHPSRLTPEARQMLERIAALAKERQVRVVYALPWYFTAEESAAANRESRARLLEEIAGILPVLDDPALGIQTDPALFSDTNYHLTAAGSEARSRILARGLIRWLER